MSTNHLLSSFCVLSNLFLIITLRGEGHDPHFREEDVAHGQEGADPGCEPKAVCRPRLHPHLYFTTCIFVPLSPNWPVLVVLSENSHSHPLPGNAYSLNQ